MGDVRLNRVDTTLGFEVEVDPLDALMFVRQRRGRSELDRPRVAAYGPGDVFLPVLPEEG